MENELKDASTTHERRASIGVRLSLLGDTRPGVSLRRADGVPDIVWCAVTPSVPPRKITLKGDAGIFPEERFYISKYPITWAQFRAFLEASDGFGKRQWWNELGRQVTTPGKQFNRYDNHPAENLTWFEAVAFCTWLSAKLGYQIQLPTEWQWQQAATGGDPNNQYPWGAEWEASNANTYEFALVRSTAVGMYPQGASPVGALDMSGNVWEWCLNKYDDPKDTSLEGLDKRVVRGGSWGNYGDDVRATSRYGYAANFRNHDVGFRVVSSSLLSF
jgi:formylglycine-generating enzyme required for sulfatase activity